MRRPKEQENKPNKINANQDPPGIDWSTILKMAMPKSIRAVNTQSKTASP